MTSSYLVLTAPGGTDVTHEKTRVIRDGFTLLGFLFPWLWLLAHRLWLYALAAFLLQGLGGVLMDRPGLWPAGFAITLGTCILAGFEGQNLRIRNLASKGWNEEAVITADSLATAEEIFFRISRPMPMATACRRRSGGDIRIPRPPWQYDFAWSLWL
ncbi:DUF2628 domain-containing protein [Rhizobium gallicum]|nr:DUF2628 domain-containing protein [Rhizobium gallicum]ULJ71509.1 DUF2628 domain-containing protein [Rhizobium gallicum]